ncbi:MAG: hypothetical protein DRR11_19590 [Gammaproteobacteria bacterium]|nr:MAG: hypothetical protein DRR11_19590 [Gammaproteobacteria bacterium]
MDEAATELTERQRYWLKKLQACESEGKSLSSYAADQGFHVGAIYAAKKTLIRKGVLPQASGVRFQRAQTQAMNVSDEWRIRFPNGVSVEFSGAADAGSLSTILSTVARLE